MKRYKTMVLLLTLFVIVYMVGCEQLLPEETSTYDRVSMFYTSHSAMLKECVSECQAIYSQAPLGNYQVRKLDGDTLQLTHLHDGAASKSRFRNEQLNELFRNDFFIMIDFSYNYVEFHIDTLGNAQRMLVYLPSDDPYSIYCAAESWSSAEKDGGTLYRIENENDDNTVFYKRIAEQYYYVEQHY